MNNLYNPSKIFSSNALIGSMEKYLAMYKRSLENPDKFWAEEAEKFVWFEKWNTVCDFNYDVRKGNIFIKWFWQTCR